MSLTRLLYVITNRSNHPRRPEYEFGIIVAMNFFCILSVLTLVIMGVIVTFFGNHKYMACANFFTAACVIALMIYYKITARYEFYKMAVTVITGLFFIYLVSTGGIDDTGPLWSYIFPVFAYSILGHDKGNIAILIEFVIYAIILFYPGVPLLTADYTFNFKMRFLLSGIFVSALTFSLEYARFNAYKKQGRLIDKLKSANDEINTLTGLIPICSQCKKIRNDKGYWEQVESYIQKRANVSFTHSICKDCADKLYGNEDWYNE